jgi:hypothetical protein
MGNMNTTKTINYKDGQHAHHQKQLSMQSIVFVVYVLPIFVVNCFGGVHVAHLCS